MVVVEAEKLNINMANNEKHTFQRIYTGDYSSIGYQDGVTDAAHNKPKSHWGVLTKRHWLNFIWQPKQSGHSYATGYNKGYDDKLLSATLSQANPTISPATNQQSINTQPTNQQGHPMSNLENYNRILSGLETAKNNIHLNITQLNEALALYSNQIEKMQEAGFLEDYADKLKAYNGLKTRIDGLQSILEQTLSQIINIQNSIGILRSQASQGY